MDKGLFGFSRPQIEPTKNYKIEFYAGSTLIVPRQSSFFRMTRVGNLIFGEFRLTPVASQAASGDFILKMPFRFAGFYDGTNPVWNNWLVGQGKFINQGTGFYMLVAYGRYTSGQPEVFFERYDTAGVWSDTIDGSQYDELRINFQFEVD
jgi:hypothetical protein